MAELNRSVTLLACQIDVPAMTTAAERDAHTDRVAAAIDAELTAGGPVELVVLPELATRDMIYRDIAFADGDLAFVMVPAATRRPPRGRTSSSSSGYRQGILRLARACIPARARL